MTDEITDFVELVTDNGSEFLKVKGDRKKVNNKVKELVQEYKEKNPDSYDDYSLIVYINENSDIEAELIEPFVIEF